MRVWWIKANRKKVYMPVINYKVENRIAYVTLNRPEAMNAFSPAMYQQFNEALTNFKKDENAWVCIIHAIGEKAFSAGVDITTIPLDIQNSSPQELTDILSQYTIDIEGEYYCDKPIIAALHGYCIGEGLSIALSCDLRIAEETTVFCLPEAKMGIPTVNAAIHGANKIGVSNILELLLLGEKRYAAWAYRTGMVNKVVPEGKALEAAIKWAEQINRLSPLAVRATKKVAVQSRYQSFQAAETTIGPTKRNIMQTDDAKEAILAFLEKRNPVFKGR